MRQNATRMMLAGFGLAAQLPALPHGLSGLLEVRLERGGSSSKRGIMHGIQVAELWRYPIKSLRGESMQSAILTHDGIEGDRVVHVAGRRGPLTGRTRHGLLTIPVSTGPDGVPRVNGHQWDSAEAAEIVRTHGGADARLVADSSPERFDVLNLLVATDGAVERFGYDVRRLRPNIVLSGVPADIEPELPGHAFAIGDAVIGVHSVRQRCIVTTIDPDSGVQDLDAFRRIRTEFDGGLALNCWVVRSGVLQVGHGARTLPLQALQRPGRIGGWIVGAPYPHTTART